MSSKIPRGTQLPTETRKMGHKVEFKDAANGPQKPDAVLKPQKENMQRNYPVSKAQRGISTRSGQQAELKQQNQHLVAANEELQNSLAEAKQKVSELELRVSELGKENAEVQKNLKDSHVLLVSAKIDPGERVGEAARQSEDDRKSVLSLSSHLLHELRAFGDEASQHRARLEDIQKTMREVGGARAQMLQDMESCSQEAAELDRALEEAEALLL